MSSVKAVYVPRFGSQQGSSQRNESQPDHQTPDQAEPSARRPADKRGKKRGDDGRENSRSILKVKLPKFYSSTLLGKETKEVKMPKTWTSKPAADKTKAAEAEGGETQSAGTDSAAADQSVFCFSQRSNVKTTTEKKKAKLSVLRTISRMLEENQLIRQRLVALTQPK